MKNRKKGFTFVELSLALVFVSVLLITIAWLTLHLTTVYEKGLAMKAVNSVGKELVDDFSRAVSASPALTIDSLCAKKYNKTTNQYQYNNCMNDSARKFSYQQRYNKVKIAGVERIVPTNGVFCTGRYSYIWNSAYVLNPTDYPRTTTGNYQATFNYSGGTNNNFRLLKVSDFNRELCTEHMDNSQYLYDDSPVYTLSGMAPETNEELLDNSENNLALYDMSIFAPTVHELTSSAYYSGTFILATLRGGIDINSTGEFCSDPPDNLNTDFAYCAINKFNFAMQANGEKLDSER
ncbi:MAG: hypothetical protein Q4E70_00565 [Candidatus Saccharibacteria bacterium]|nr:hypothetical protein [Candidatus Saccharibacteria bacterium]